MQIPGTTHSEMILDVQDAFYFIFVFSPLVFIFFHKLLNIGYIVFFFFATQKSRIFKYCRMITTVSPVNNHHHTQLQNLFLLLVGYTESSKSFCYNYLGLGIWKMILKNLKIFWFKMQSFHYREKQKFRLTSRNSYFLIVLLIFAS